MNHEYAAKTQPQNSAADRLEERLADLRGQINYLENIVGRMVDLPPRMVNPSPATLSASTRPPFFTRIENAADYVASLSEELGTLSNMLGDRL